MRRLQRYILAHLPTIIVVMAVTALVLAAVADFDWGP